MPDIPAPTDAPALISSRARLAKRMAAASGSADPRYAAAFAAVARAAFLPPGPWWISTGHGYTRTASADPALLDDNILVALDMKRGINTGEPLLHAAWLGLAAPRPGEHVLQIGAGGGYYTALLAELVRPGGHVTGYEIEPALAALATRHLAAYPDVDVIAADATTAPLPAADLLYVCAGVVAPPASWLQALRPGGRIILPWQPLSTFGWTLLLTRQPLGFAVRVAWPVGFIPCIGADDAGRARLTPTPRTATTIRAAYLSADRAPDTSAVAIYPDVWFSADAITAQTDANDTTPTTLA